MIRPSRIGLVAVAAVASALLVAGPAVAQVKPPVGSTECTALVDKDPGVINANQGSAGGLPAARQTAESALCGPKAAAPTTKATTSTTTSSAAPTTTTEVQSPSVNRRVVPGNDAPTPKRAGRPAGDRDCADFATQQQAQRYFESIGGSATNNADRLDANGNGVACESLADDGDNGDAEATATGDDGSTAKTSGDQVTEVPEGSAQTGGA